MASNQLTTEHPTQAPPSSQEDRLAGFRPSTIALIVAATCFAGLVWGAAERNWVLVATETPAVLALLGVWAMARARRSGRRVAIVASTIGALCSVELWIAMTVLDARGTTLAIIVAASTGLTVAAVGALALLGQTQPKPHR